MTGLLQHIVAQQRKPRSEWVRKTAIVVFPLIFLTLIFSPGYFLGPQVDALLSIQRIAPSPINYYVGGLIFLAGLFLYLWTIVLFALIGEGTQTPTVPTRRLITSGPFAYSRNPMVSGVILLITGLGLLGNSIGFIAVGLIIPFTYLIFIKLVEEKELEAQFGQEYLEYKTRVPFIIPKFWG